MGTHPIFESDFDCLTEISDTNSWIIREIGFVLKNTETTEKET